MKLNTEKLKPYVERFMEFYQTQEYWDEEREYKEKLVKSIQKGLGERPLRSVVFLDNFLNTHLKDLNAFVNLIGSGPAVFKFVDWLREFSDSDAKSLFYSLIYGDEETSIRIQSFLKEYNDFVRGSGETTNLPLSFPTLFLAYYYPNDYLVYKHNYMRDFWASFIDNGGFEGRPIEKYELFSKTVPDLKNLLDNHKPHKIVWSDNPKIDMLDVQTFVYLLAKPREGLFDGIGEDMELGTKVNHFVMANICWIPNWDHEPTEEEMEYLRSFSDVGHIKGGGIPHERITFNPEYVKGGYQYGFAFPSSFPVQIEEDKPYMTFFYSRKPEGSKIVGIYGLTVDARTDSDWHFQYDEDEDIFYHIRGDLQFVVRFEEFVNFDQNRHGNYPRNAAFTYIDRDNTKAIIADAKAANKDSPEVVEKLNRIEGLIGSVPTSIGDEGRNEMLDEIVDILKTKRQIILCGPPGTSKTWFAEKIITSFTGGVRGDSPTEYDGEIEITPKLTRALINAYKSEEDDLYENLPKNDNRLTFIAGMRKYIDKFIDDSNKKGVGKYEESSLQYLSKELRSATGLSVKPWLKISQFPIWGNYYDEYGKEEVTGYLKSVIGVLESISRMESVEECDIRLQEFIDEGIPKTGLMLGALLYPLQPDIYPILGVGPHEGSKKIGINMPFMNLDEYILASTLCRDFLVKYRTDLNATDLLDVTAFFDWLSYSEAEDYFSDTEKPLSEPIDNYYQIVQFHPSYTYEDFVRGLVAKPLGSGVTFEPRDKIFALMCERAKTNSDKKFVLIIDEINRADISKVFGELIYGLEYRDKPIATPYEVDGSTTLVIPPNLYIIGTMNTADKSIAMLDYALRRRFAFIPMYPDIGVINNHYEDGTERQMAKNLYKKVEKCFEASARDLQVGHTYFLKTETYNENEMDFEDYLKIRFIYEIAPLIHEYILAGEEGINAPKIKEAYEKGDIKENLEAIFDRWVIGEDVEEEVDKSEITDENQDDTDDGVE